MNDKEKKKIIQDYFSSLSRNDQDSIISTLIDKYEYEDGLVVTSCDFCTKRAIFDANDWWSIMECAYCEKWICTDCLEKCSRDCDDNLCCIDCCTCSKN